MFFLLFFGPLTKKFAHHWATTSQLSRDLYTATGTRVTRVTVSKRLNERVFFARRLAVCALLTSTNKRVLLAWCRQHSDWNMEQWAIVLFVHRRVPF